MGKGMVAFLRAALGFEPEIMRLGRAEEISHCRQITADIFPKPPTDSQTPRRQLQQIKGELKKIRMRFGHRYIRPELSSLYAMHNPS